MPTTDIWFIYTPPPKTLRRWIKTQLCRVLRKKNGFVVTEENGYITYRPQ